MISSILTIATLIVGSLAQDGTASSSSDRGVPYETDTYTYTDTVTHFTHTATSTGPTSDATTQTSVTLFWDAEALGSYYPGEDDADSGFSVMSADACASTYVTTLGGPSYDLDAASTWTIIASKSSSVWEEISTTSAKSSTESLHRTCTPEGTTKAHCQGVYSISFNGTQLSQTFSSTIQATLTPIVYPVTAGSAKLAAATGTCTKPGNAAPSGISRDVYKVVIVPAALVAAAFV